MKIVVGLLASISIVLAGCGGGGGGGGGGGSRIPTTDPVKVTIQGIAAIGAPMAGATILVIDASGAEVCKATAGQDGAYTCVLSDDPKSPLVVSATSGDVTYYAPLAESKSGTVNLTKLTTLIAAQLSPTGEPSSLAAQIRDGSAKVTAADLKQKTDDLRAALQPLLTNAGNDIDPISGKFSADGTGHDKALMALDVLIKPTNGKSNINVTVKTEFTIGTELPAITFVSGDKPPALPASVATSKLPATDEDALIANFIKRINDCYALPKSTRVSVDNKNVIALECRGLFPADEPNNYKDDGNKVGATGAFSTLFSEAATGTTFTKPEVEFRYPGDELRLRFYAKKWNNETVQRLRLKRNINSYRALGNQYDYGFYLRPWTEERKLVNRTDLSYYATGFNVWIFNVQENGAPKFLKAIVTPPGGFSPFELRPLAALNFLSLYVENTQYTTNTLRLAGSFISSPDYYRGTKPNLPRELPERLVWHSSPSKGGADWTDDEIDKIPENTRWKADIYLKDGTIATQYYETTVAPLNLPELKKQQWVKLSEKTKNDFVASTQATGSINFPTGYTAYTINWEYKIGVVPPSEIWTIGLWSSNQRFNDIQRVPFVSGSGSGSGSGTITCTNQSNLDNHCQTNSSIDGIHLYSLTERDMLYASIYFSYLIPY